MYIKKIEARLILYYFFKILFKKMLFEHSDPLVGTNFENPQSKFKFLQS